MIYITFLYFILGIVFISYIVPLLDSLLSVVLTRLELTKGKYQVEIQKMNKEIQEIAESDEEACATRQIGFVIDEDDMEEYDDNEDEDV